MSMVVEPAAETDYLALYDAYHQSQPANDYVDVHRKRFQETARLAGPTLAGAKSILELGGQSQIGRFARDVFGATLIEYSQDLRLPYDLPSNKYDVVLCLEVLEHIKDSPLVDTTIEQIAHFNYSGVKNLLAESFRVLKSGGAFIVTSPNVLSTDAIANILRMRHPYNFGPHVREMAPGEINIMANQAGFQTRQIHTFWAWGEADTELRQAILDFIMELGFDPRDRGDDAFLEFVKP